MRLSSLRNWFAVALLAVGLGVIVVDTAEARRGGSFGSRGMRTFQAPPPTATAPNQTAPMNRSMTPRTQANQPNAAASSQAAAQTRRPGLFGGMAGGLLGGLMLGGLIGMLMGNGLGGMAGFLGLLIQVALIGLVVMMVMRMIRGRQQPALAGAAGPLRRDASSFRPASGATRSSVPQMAPATRQQARSQWEHDEIGITENDLNAFEARLSEVQAAFSREDYAALRQLTTPEIMSYLAEELSQNAVKGVRNEVTDVKLLQGDVAEAWREGSSEYATLAMRIESRDVLVDRETGRIVSGDPDHPTEVLEHWTFVREDGGDWKLSAIQSE